MPPTPGHQGPADDPHHDPALALALRELGADEQDRLTIGGLDARQLVERFGSPLYVFDAAVLRRRLRRVQDAVGPRVGVLWSVKANPSVAVTRCFAEAGAGAEVASLGELHVALAAGLPAAALRFAGPGKTDAELRAALELGLGTFHVESLDEVESLARLSTEPAARPAGDDAVRIAVRVNLPMELRGSRMRMGGATSRFGIDAEQLPAVVARIRSARGLRFVGLHVYGGTQCFDADAFVAHAATLCERAAGWERELGLRIDELDLGGGFGVPVFRGDPLFDLATAGAGVQDLVRLHDRADRRWFVELGRYLAAPAGVYLATVSRSKESGGEPQLALDGGMHQAAAAAGMGTVVRRPPLVCAAERLRAACTTTAQLGGPLCTPADQFGTVALPQLSSGDLIAVLHAGAYGLSYSPHGFLSHPTPAEVLVDAGEAALVRRRGRADDVLRDQVW